jgi:glycosyltransferase involved in cell wall biosynthesis
MKILYVAPLDSIHTYRWINFFSRNHSVSLLIKEGDVTWGDISKKVNKIFFKYYDLKILEKNKVFILFKLIKNVIRCYRAIKKENFDLIHLHYLSYDLCLLFAFINIRPLIFTPWGSDLLAIPQSGRRGIFMRFLIRRIISKSAGYCCDSSALERAIIFFGGTMAKIEKIGFGADTAMYSPDVTGVNLRSEYNIGDQDLIIISTRNHYPVYDIETLIYATGKVLDSTDLKFKVLIAGEGPDTLNLKMLSYRLGLNRVIHFTGRIASHLMPNYLVSSDIFVSTSLSDGGLACSTAEAMSSGTPVIITNFEDNKNWLDNESCGLLFEPRNAVELANKLISLMKNADLRKRMGSSAVEIARKKLDYGVEMLKVECWMNSLIKLDKLI